MALKKRGEPRAPRTYPRELFNPDLAERVKSPSKGSQIHWRAVCVKTGECCPHKHHSRESAMRCGHILFEGQIRVEKIHT